MRYVRAAYQLSKGAHRNQKRDGGRRYFDHPREVALILMKELKIGDWKVIVLGLLYDTLEDSFLMSPWVLEKIFGADVAISVRRLTKEDKEGYLDRLRTFGTSRDLMVKLVDRLHNLRTLSSCSKEKRRKQIAETRTEYLSLADRLIIMLPAEEKWRGIYIKEQIESLCRKFN